MSEIEIAIILLICVPVALWASEALKPKEKKMGKPPPPPGGPFLTRDELTVLKVVTERCELDGKPQVPNDKAEEWVLKAVASLVECGKLKVVTSPSGKTAYAPADFALKSQFDPSE